MHHFAPEMDRLRYVFNQPTDEIEFHVLVLFEGVRRQSWQVRGELCDMATYSLLAAEWRERSQS
ncbi:hypothetical protein KTH_56980 [Thermosporothrix hazakensis]|nr:hypothetical protein KTH_56980 [Thermosporothrix hazakensis]